MNRAVSLYLDCIRPLAALTVLLSHVSYQNLSGGQLAVFAPFGIQAVDLSFVLSGFVIAHVCASHERDARAYALSRTVRIVSVALPAILVTLLFDDVGLSQGPSVYVGGPYQPMTMGLVVRSMLFLGECWGAHRFPGSNGPFWSLGFEVWYYVCFGVFVFAPPRPAGAGPARALCWRRSARRSLHCSPSGFWALSPTMSAPPTASGNRLAG